MLRLKRDARGYPIPWIVLEDGDGHHFTVNDINRVFLCIKRDLCGICAHRLYKGRWFVGGPLAAFDERGAYLDPPLHHECATYALRVCPYLALPSYRGRIEGRTVKEAQLLVAYRAIDRRPPLFISAMAIAQTVRDGPVFVPKRPFKSVEFWRDGSQLDPKEGERIVNEELAKPRPEATPERLIKVGK
jgi:hypothetical protein